jgi:hypothetical protein
MGASDASRYTMLVALGILPLRTLLFVLAENRIGRVLDAAEDRFAARLGAAFVWILGKLSLERKSQVACEDVCHTVVTEDDIVQVFGRPGNCTA